DRTYFKTGGEELTDKSEEQLKNIATIMKTFYYSEVKIGGYTDNTGSDEANLPLSQRRAETVKKELINMGVEENRIQAEGYGSQHPICPENDTEVCRAQNRRVDILLLKK